MSSWVAALFDWWSNVVSWGGALAACGWGGWLIGRADPAGFTLLFLGSVMLVVLVGYRRQKASGARQLPRW